MLKKLTARDIMIPLGNYSTVTQEDSVRHAIYTLKTSIYRDKQGAFHGHRALVVLNEKEEICGILTLLDILKAVGLKEHYNDPWIKTASWSWYYMNRIHETEGVKVKDIMRPIFLVTVNSDQPLEAIVRKMLLQEENLIPVLERNIPIGVIRTIDLFWSLSPVL